jgi:DNA-directed RNA polymerase subunit beta'
LHQIIFLSPETGDPILTPSQDMVLGCYYLTANNPTEQVTQDQYFLNFEDAIKAYKQSLLSLHSFVWVRIDPKEHNEESLLAGFNFRKEEISDNIIYLSPELQAKKDSQGNIFQIYFKTTPGRILLNQSFEIK